MEWFDQLAIAVHNEKPMKTNSREKMRKQNVTPDEQPKTQEDD